VRVRIPAIGVDAPIERLGLDPDGAVAAPAQWDDAGWYADGPRPGQPGPAVLLGHVDSRTGPAVFARLARVPAGAAVLVDRADGTTVRFRVRGRLQVAKSRFPSDLVYAPTLAPSLRLVTCGGAFDRRTGHYRDNIVVTALPEGVSP
jgi:sortase (surface protein transpeptidase)